MASKQTNTNNSSAGAAAARAPKARTSRVTSSKHSKSVPAEEATVMVKEEHPQAVEEIVASLTEAPGSNEPLLSDQDPVEIISKLAYSYWESRNGMPGDPLEDWVRAEEEYRRRLAAV